MSNIDETRKGFNRAADIFMGFVCVISLLAVAGWLLNQPVLASFGPSYIPMAPVTGLIFLGLVGAWLIHKIIPERHRMNRLVQVSLLGMLIIVFILALRYFTGYGPDIEQLLSPNPPFLGQIITAHMSPLTAAGFFLVIPAMMMLTGAESHPRYKSISAGLSLIVLILSSLNILGYVYGAPLFYGGALIPVAVSTALSFFFLSLGLLLTAGPSYWPVRNYIGASLKARLMRAFIPASLVIILIQGLLNTIADPWFINPALKAALAALVACLIVLLIISVIAHNLSSDIDRGNQARLKAESDLKQSEARFRSLYENVPTGIYRTSADGHILLANPALVRMLGYDTYEELAQRNLASRDYEPEYLRQEFQHRIERDGEILGLESAWKRKDGSIIYVRENAHLVQNEKNQPFYYEGTVEDITERRQALEALRKSESNLQAILQSTADGILAVGNVNEVLYANERFAEIWRIPPAVMASKDDATLLGYVLDQLYAPQSFLENVRDLYQSNKESFDTLYFKDGRIFERLTRPLLQGEQVRGRIWSFRDITERKRYELVQNAIYGITQAAITSDGIDALYHSIHSILGELIPAENFFIALYDSATRLISFPYYIDQYDDPPPTPTQIQGLTGYVIRTGRPLLATREVFDRLVQQNEVEVVGTVGGDWMGVPLKLGEQMIGVIALQSYTQEIHYKQQDMDLLEFVSTQAAQAIERKRLEEEVRRLSLTDELTGLYNRRGLSYLAEQELKLAFRNKNSMLLFFCDVDDLKMINDTQGHSYGDLALKEVSALLRENFREVDIVARIGGDEFVVLVLDGSTDSAEILTNRIQTVLKQRAQQPDVIYALSLSIGVAHYDPAHPCTIGELISQADGLMYDKKQASKTKKQV